MKSYKVTMRAFIDDIPFMQEEYGFLNLTSSQLLDDSVGVVSVIADSLTVEQRQEIIKSAIVAFENTILAKVEDIIEKNKQKA